jgi:F-type H+-transporting ATPase subunit delta
MAELTTIARPYAGALFAAAKEAGTLDGYAGLADELAAVAAHPLVAEIAADPRLGSGQVFDLLTGLMKSKLPEGVASFLRLMIENDRLAALPEVARQFRQLKNAAEGVADCVIESAFPMSDAQVQDLVDRLAGKFGLRLKPEVRVDARLIGGVRVTVGDHVMDTTVKTRLAQMQVAMTAA